MKDSQGRGDERRVETSVLDLYTTGKRINERISDAELCPSLERQNFDQEACRISLSES
jgi:DNA-binding TFAR19-related protein (PDSD5 family)